MVTHSPLDFFVTPSSFPLFVALFFNGERTRGREGRQTERPHYDIDPERRGEIKKRFLEKSRQRGEREKKGKISSHRFLSFVLRETPGLERGKILRVKQREISCS